MHEYALQGDGRPNRRINPLDPNYFDNTLIMKGLNRDSVSLLDLPSLEVFTGNRWNCMCMGSVILESILYLSF